MLADPRGQPVTEGGVGVEALDLVMRVGRLQRGAGDLRRPGEWRAARRVDQPWPAPHQGDQEELGIRVKVKREQGGIPVRPGARAAGAAGAGRDRPGHDDQAQRLALVEHRPGSDQRGSVPDEPPGGRLAGIVHPRQPYPVAVALGIQRMRVADVRYPGAAGHRADQARPPGQPAPGRDHQVRVVATAEHEAGALRYRGYPSVRRGDVRRRGDRIERHRRPAVPSVPSCPCRLRPAAPCGPRPAGALPLAKGHVRTVARSLGRAAARAHPGVRGWPAALAPGWLCLAGARQHRTGGKAARASGRVLPSHVATARTNGFAPWELVSRGRNSLGGPVALSGLPRPGASSRH